MHDRSRPNVVRISKKVRPVLTDPPLPAPAPERDKRGRVASTEAARALASLRRPRFVPIKYTFLDTFKPHNEHRLEWQQQRLEELSQAHGYVSAGVAALIGAAGWHHAAAEFANERAAIEGDLEQFNMATRFSNAARGNVLAAWDLCQREAVVRRANNPSEGHTMTELLDQLSPQEPPIDLDPDPDNEPGTPDDPDEAS